MLNIIVFGATGGTGKHFLDRALAAGHRVTAFVRDPSKVSVEHDNLSVVRGDAFDADSVAEAIAGHDVVVSTLGAPPSSRRTLRTKAHVHLVRGMRKHGVERLISLSTMGIGDHANVMPFYMGWLLEPLWLGRAFRDHEGQEAVIASSDLDWTIVRPPFMTDGPAKGTYQHGFPNDERPPSMQIARADVAGFMLEQVDSGRYSQQTVGVCD